jgi:hypothetical protein
VLLSGWRIICTASRSRWSSSFGTKGGISMAADEASIKTRRTRVEGKRALRVNYFVDCRELSCTMDMLLDEEERTGCRQ